MLRDENTLEIYTDGSTYWRRSWSGGAGVVFVFPGADGLEDTYELGEAYGSASSIEMELQACILALSEARTNPRFSRFHNIIIYSDSQFLVEFYKTAQFTWSRNGWLRAGGAPVSNVGQWKQFLAAMRKVGKPVEIVKVTAHDGDTQNERADRLAKAAAATPVSRPFRVRQLGRKLSSQRTRSGSVAMQGQEMAIRIIERQYFHEHQIDRYRYEVMNPDSPFFGCVDFIFSEFYMKRQHCYMVRVNQDRRYPRVLELLGEIEPSALPDKASEGKA